MKHLLLAGIALLGLYAPCLSGVARAEDLRFAIVPKSMNNPYFDLARDGCEAEAKKIGVQCIYQGPVEQEPATQVQIIQDMISRHVDGIAIAVADAPAVGRVIRQARQANIPVITFDADAPDSQRQAYVGTNNKELGLAIGRELAKVHPKPGSFALISGGPAAANLQERVDGVRQVLKGAGWTEVAGSPTFCNDDSALAVQQMTDLMTAHPDLAALVPVGGWPLFSAEAYRRFVTPHMQALKDGRFAIVSADTLPVEIDALKASEVNALVGQRPAEMGAKAMDILLALHKGQNVPKITYVGLDVVTPQNVAQFGK
ncbi:MAG TPA: sugar-binding protein [Rhodopila sp.]|nr:sugar-binding protein [Rhodopila sp.]